MECSVPHRLAKAVLALTGVSALAVGGAEAASVAAAPPPAATHVPAAVGGPLIRSNSHEALPLQGGSVQSSNWSGYAVTPSSSNVTAVTSTFTVPTAGLILPGFSANWAGIGGYASTDLIQAGVAEDSVPTNPLLGDQYYAWYELLPGDAVQLTNCTGDTSCTVNPGDVVSVNIFQTANDVWTIDVSDSGHWSWTDTDVAYTSTHSSAEWILEAPQVDGLPTLVSGDGTSFFGPTSTYTVGSGAAQTIASGDPTQIDLTTPEVSTINLATPSALASDGQSFNVCVYAESCATP
jgi:Peptidase A4 family